MQKYNIRANLVCTTEQLYEKATNEIQMNGSMGWLVALLFYVHGKHLRSCRDGQLT